MKDINKETSCSFGYTHSLISHSRRRCSSKERKEDATLQLLDILGYSWWWFLLCALLGRGALSLYGFVTTTIWYASSIWCTRLVLGFLHYLFLLRDGSWLDYIIDEIYLRKVGWVFPLVWGFSEDKILCLIVLVYVVHISNTWYNR